MKTILILSLTILSLSMVGQNNNWAVNKKPDMTVLFYYESLSDFRNGRIKSYEELDDNPNIKINDDFSIVRIGDTRYEIENLVKEEQFEYLAVIGYLDNTNMIDNISLLIEPGSDVTINHVEVKEGHVFMLVFNMPGIKLFALKAYTYL